MRILKVVFVLLLFITVVEAIYYYLAIFNPNLLSIGSLNITKSDRTSNSVVSDVVIGELENELIPKLKKLSSSENQNYYLIDELFGKVGRISSDSARISIQILNSDNQEINIQNIPIKILPTRRFYRIVDNQKKDILFSDIKSGDEIIFRMTNDLIKPENTMIEYIIK